MLTNEHVEQVREALGSQVPFLNVNRSTLGGEKNAAILLVFSMEPRSEWKNGILENSNYARFHLSPKRDGRIEVENFSGYGLPKFRKATVKTVQDAIVKIYAFIVKAKGLDPVEIEKIKAHTLKIMLGV